MFKVTCNFSIASYLEKYFYKNLFVFFENAVVVLKKNRKFYYEQQPHRSSCVIALNEFETTIWSTKKVKAKQQD